MDSQPNLIDLNTELSVEPVQTIDHQYVNCNGSESNSNDQEDEATYSIFAGAACLSSNSTTTSKCNNKDPFDMRTYLLCVNYFFLSYLIDIIYLLLSSFIIVVCDSTHNVNLISILNLSKKAF